MNFVEREIDPTIASIFSEAVLFRIARGDHKGRPFGTPQNPNVPTIEQFNPRVTDVAVSDLADLIVAKRHGIFPDAAVAVARLSNDELCRFRIDDPISAAVMPTGLSLTGGHHRVHELLRRVRNGLVTPATVLRILLHD